ncbi:MAG: alpha/beta fold hydrolase [Anaerolineales bacterium]|nr:alpha/beta fold hydrolase [Anaerolineales bacterium]
MTHLCIKFGCRKKMYLIFLAGILFLLSACGAGQSFQSTKPIRATEPRKGEITIQVPTLSETISPSETQSPTISWTPTWTATPTLISTTTPTPDPKALLTIDGLTTRTYGRGELVINENLAENSYFTRYLISYPSDSLTIYGFMNIPQGEGPFPVVIAIHGYIDPLVYRTLDYTTGYADALARAGYLVIHPNLRNYPPSDNGSDLFRVGMAVDVLNLIAIVQSYGSTDSALEAADPQRIGLWGHSMGGGVSTRVITINPDVRAVVLYGAMSGDERKNYEAIFRWSQGERGSDELSFTEDEMQRISPIYHLDRIQSAVSIHHGRSDDLVPLTWSNDLCERLRDLDKQVECYIYDGQPHTFIGEGNDRFIQRTLEFYDRFLRVP